MAEQQNEKKDKTKVKRKKVSTFDMLRRQNKMRSATNLSKDIRNFSGFLVGALIVWFIMSGIINQVETGENIIDFAFRTGERISDFLLGLISGEFLDFRKDGIYLK